MVGSAVGGEGESDGGECCGRGRGECCGRRRGE